MPIDPNIPLMAGRGVTPRMNPAQVAQAAEQIRATQDLQAARKQKEAARAIWQEAGGDWRKAQGLATERGLMEPADYFGGLADKQETAMAQTRKALADMEENQRKEATGRIQEYGKLSKMVLSQPEGARQKAYDFAARRMGRPDLAGQYDEDELRMAVQLADAFNPAQMDEAKPVSDIGKLNWELKRGLISKDQYDREYARINAPRQPLVQVGYSQPFEVTDPETGKAKLVQQDKAGNLREVSGYAPKSESKPLTDSQANALGFGVRAMEAAEIARGIEQEPGSGVGSGIQRIREGVPFGVGQYFTPDKLQQYNQAKQNFITAVLRKESGAAISTGEFTAEDRKYFPQPGDTSDVIAQKARARQTAIKVLETAAGRPLGSVDTSTPPRPSAPKAAAHQGPTATDAKGNKVMWNGSSWVPVK